MTTLADAGLKPYDGHRRLKDEVVRRWNAPRKDPTYGLYFITSLIIISGAGFWLEVVKMLGGLGTLEESTAALRSAIGTYFPAVLGGTAMQLAISETLRSLRALGQCLAWVFASLAILIVFAANLSDHWAILLGFAGSAAALAFWWIVNADDHTLRDDVPPEAATGGKDPSAPLLGDGALAEFET